MTFAHCTRWRVIDLMLNYGKTRPGVPWDCLWNHWLAGLSFSASSHPIISPPNPTTPKDDWLRLQLIDRWHNLWLAPRTPLSHVMVTVLGQSLGVSVVTAGAGPRSACATWRSVAAGDHRSRASARLGCPVSWCPGGGVRRLAGAPTYWSPGRAAPRWCRTGPRRMARRTQTARWRRGSESISSRGSSSYTRASCPGGGWSSHMTLSKEIQKGLKKRT